MAFVTAGTGCTLAGWLVCVGAVFVVAGGGVTVRGKLCGKDFCGGWLSWTGMTGEATAEGGKGTDKRTAHDANKTALIMNRGRMKRTVACGLSDRKKIALNATKTALILGRDCMCKTLTCSSRDNKSCGYHETGAAKP
jgi:hypothetical protein